MSANPQLSYAEYQLLLRHDLMSFIERSFYELNPQTNLFKSPHINSGRESFDPLMHRRGLLR